MSQATLAPLGAGIGEMVPDYQQISIRTFINNFGIIAFSSAVYNGAWSDVAFAYIHPCEDMKKTKQFKAIQEAFINAYC